MAKFNNIADRISVDYQSYYTNRYITASRYRGNHRLIKVVSCINTAFDNTVMAVTPQSRMIPSRLLCGKDYDCYQIDRIFNGYDYRDYISDSYITDAAKFRRISGCHRCGGSGYEI